MHKDAHWNLVRDIQVVQYIWWTVELIPARIIVQKAVPILRNDTVESLSARILEQEHKAYAQAVKMFMKQRVRNPAVNGFCKPFNDIDGAIQFALKRGMSYMWRNGDHTMISEKPPESVPHVAVTPDDTTDVLQSRLDNMIVLDHASVAPRQPTTQ